MDLPELSEEDMAAYLNSVAQANAGRLAADWPIAPVIVRGVALELAVGIAQRGAPLPKALVALLAMLLELPSDFLDDPGPLYCGDRSDSGHRRCRALAEALDAKSIKATGKPLALKALERAIQEAFGESPARSTLRQWREDPDYRLWLDVIAKR
jgi:hypothetical protein